MSFRIPRQLFTSLAVLTGLAAPASAWSAAVFYSTAFSITDVVNTPVGSTFSGTLSALQLLELPRFNPTFGTLQSVELQFQSDYTVSTLGQARDTRGEFVFFPFGDSNDTGIDASVQGSLSMRLFDPGAAVATLNFPAINSFCYERISTADTVTCLAQTSSSTAYDALLPVGAIGLMDFVGSDPINLLASFNATFSGVCDSNDLGDSCEFATRVSWLGLAGVTYTYALNGPVDPPDGGDPGNDVPEPGSPALIAGGGLLMLAVMRRGAAWAGRAAIPRR